MRTIKNFIKTFLGKVKSLIFKRKKLSIFLGILLIIIIAIFSFISGKTNQTIVPQTSVVMKEDIEYRVKVNGTVESLNEQVVLASVQGEVKDIHVKQGDLVNKGDLIATIDTTEIDERIQKSSINLDLEKAKLILNQEELNSAKLTLSEIEQKYTFLKDTYESKLKLYEAGAISKVALDEAKMAMNEGYNKYIITKDSVENGSYVQNLNLQKKQVNLAELEYTSLVNEREKHLIKSPIDGIVAEIYIELGDTIDIQKQLFYVVNNSQLEVTANVSEYDAKNIKTGNKVTVTSDGVDNYTYEAEITFVSPIAKKLQSSNGTESVVEVKTIISDENSTLKSGFNVNVDILCDRKEGALTVPYESILTTKEGKHYVFVLKGENQEQYQVKTGIEGALKVEVISDDLKEGDIILINVNEGMLMLENSESKAGTKND